VIGFFLDHPVILGICIGGGLIGGPLGIIGWCVGYDHAMRQVGQWLQPKKREEAIGDVPTLPASYGRRSNLSVHGGYRAPAGPMPPLPTGGSGVRKP